MKDSDKIDILFWGAIGYFIVAPVIGLLLILIVWALS